MAPLPGTRTSALPQIQKQYISYPPKMGLDPFKEELNMQGFMLAQSRMDSTGVCALKTRASLPIIFWIPTNPKTLLEDVRAANQASL